MTTDEQSKETLRNFLAFYRENRELIAAVTGGKLRQVPQNTNENADMGEKKESRPREEAGNADILEEYLKCLAV